MLFFGIKGLAGWVAITEIPDYPNYCQLFRRNKIPLTLYTNCTFHTNLYKNLSLINMLHILSNKLIFRNERKKTWTCCYTPSEFQ